MGKWRKSWRSSDAGKVGKSMIRYLLISVLLFNIAFGFIDEDLDGVDDTVDKCPGTPFDVLVNADGCPLEEEKGVFYIKFSTYYSKDEDSDNLFSYLTLSYSNNNWYFSLTGSYDNKNSNIGNTYIFGSYIKQFSKLYIQSGITFKIPTSDYSKKVDISPSILLDFFVGNLDIFAYTKYTLTWEDNQKNSLYTSIGLGYQFYLKFYSSVSLDYSQSQFEGLGDEKYISVYGIYDITEKIFFSILYSYGLNKNATDHTIFSKLGYRF